MKKRGVLLALGLTGMLALGVVAGSSLEDAFAQQPPPPPSGHGPEGHEHGMHHDWSPGKHIEGRIAFLRTELKITPAQAPLFDAFANLMRANAKKMDDKFAKMHAEHEKMRAEHDKGGAMPQHMAKSPIDKIQEHITAEQEHIQHATEMLNVLKPLYASFSDDQKKAADELLAHHGYHHRM